MARPIEPTAPLTGQDAERLLAALDTGASQEEMHRREVRAVQVLQDLDAGRGIFVSASVNSRRR
jgi:hypothetical protein